MYCINPQCQHQENPAGSINCRACGTPLLIEGQYKLIKPLRPLSICHTAEVFEALDGDTPKVLKILKDNSPQTVWMFEREVLVLRSLDHPGIPKVEDFFSMTPNGSKQRIQCLVMEKVMGQNLEQWRQKNHAPAEALVVDWLRQLTEILNVLHEKHIFHRDIKPSNIILQPNGQLVLIDFGSVRDISGTYLAKVNSGDITQVVSGGYTPPEQMTGHAVPQSDFFALGRTFVYLLTGISPLRLKTNLERGKLDWRNKAPSVPRYLANFIDELMSNSPENRPQNTRSILKYLSKPGLQGSRNKYLPKAVTDILIFFSLVSLGGMLLIYPLAAESFHRRGHEEFHEENLHVGWKEYEGAITLKPERIGTAHYNLGVLYEDSQEFESAIAQYKIAVKFPGKISISAVNNLARLLIWQKQQPKQALNILQQALAAYPDHPLQNILLKNLGWAYFQLGDYQKAEVALQKSLEADKESQASAYCLLAKTRQQTNPQSALPLWEKCLNHESRLPEVKTWQLEAMRYLRN